MATHSSTIAWKIPWTEEPGGLQSMGSHSVGHDWATSLSLFTFHFHALEKEMATHSSVLAWRILGTGEPGGLPSMGSHRVGHDWSDLAAAAARWCDLFPTDLLFWGNFSWLALWDLDFLGKVFLERGNQYVSPKAGGGTHTFRPNYAIRILIRSIINSCFIAVIT